VITEYSVVPKLARLVKTTIATVQQHLAQAYAQVARVPANSRSLGDLGVVRPLVQFLRTPNDEVQRATCIALAKLSADGALARGAVRTRAPAWWLTCARARTAANSAEMREAGAVPLLVGLMSSDDTALQEAAAVAIANTRRYAKATTESPRPH
jgi:hypothetical protein